MSLRQMLLALSQVNEVLNGPWPPSDEALAELRQVVSAGITAGAGTLSRMGRVATDGQPKGKGGARPTAAYEVEISGAYPMRVLGAQAVCDIINKELEQHKEKFRLTPNNLTTVVSTRGGWFRNVETSNGTVTLAARRIQGPAAEQENSA